MFPYTTLWHITNSPTDACVMCSLFHLCILYMSSHMQTALVDEEGTAMDADLGIHHNQQQFIKTEYEVIAFIKRKLTFTDRPNPIVHKASSKKL